MASTSVPGNFDGNPCPISIQFGYVQGTSPATANVLLPGSVSPQLGSLQVLNIGPSIFTGYLVGQEYDPIADNTTLHFVDWRDRLHDFHVAGAFNVQEDDGRFYHIIPGLNWFQQRRTYVTRELGQADFDFFQRYGEIAFSSVQIYRQNLFSAATLLDWLGRNNKFVVTADSLALQRLTRIYPLNLDWNNGVKVIDAVQQIMSKCGTQFTCFGYNRMHISIRGWTENELTAAVANNLISPCQLGISTGKTGQELNERGRRIIIVGDRNKWEFVYPCRANWNPNWTWGMVYGGIELSALLEAQGLTLEDKVGDLPEQFHDNETISDYDAAGEGSLPSRKTRNLMTIKEYIEKIPFKCYVIDSRYAVKPFISVIVNKILGIIYKIDNDRFQKKAEQFGSLREFPRQSDYDNSACNFKFPLSRTLVTDSNLQHITYATSRRIIRGADYPFGEQNILVPFAKGTSLEVEEVTNILTGQAEFRMRVFFNTPQFYDMAVLEGATKKFDDPNSITPDVVLVRLALDADQFVYYAGDLSSNLRVREQVQNVRNLYNAYVDGELVSVLRENFRRDLERGGQELAERPVQAEQLAQRIATQFLAHYAITRSGTLVFDDICGSTPDGLIDSVNLSYSATAGGGIQETVNFTTGFADDHEFTNPFTVTVSRKFRDEDEIIKDRLKEIAKAAAKDKGVMGKVMPIFEAGLHEMGGLMGVPPAALAFAKDGIAEIEFPVEFFDGGKVAEGGAVLVIGKPGGGFAGPPAE